MTRRAMRIIVNGLTVLSLVLTIGVAVLWVRSYWVSDALSIKPVDGTARQAGLRIPPLFSRRLQSGFYAGVWYCSWSSAWADGAGIEVTEEAINSPPVVWTWLDRSGNGVQGEIDIHASLVFCLAVTMPLIRTLQWIVRKERRRGGCPSCGYDLRATPDRCPECGAVPPAT